MLRPNGSWINRVYHLVFATEVTALKQKLKVAFVDSTVQLHKQYPHTHVTPSYMQMIQSSPCP